MARLALSLLGSFDATVDGQPIVAFASDKTRALLAYLAVEAARPHSREKLAGLLWPDSPEALARGSLSHALTILRNLTGDRHTTPPVLLVSYQTVRFNPDADAWVDVTAFSALTGSRELSEVERGVELYRGQFLEGFSLPSSSAFEEWLILEQEQLHRLMMEALARLAGAYETGGQLDRALGFVRRQLELEPSWEGAHQQAMRLLALSGRRDAALAQYQACRRLLADDLRAEPSSVTVRLYQDILDGELAAVESTRSVAIEGRPASVGLPAFVGGRATPPARPQFFAREGQLSLLEGRLTAALGGQGQVAFVVGGPGRGKTALLHEFARRALDSHPELLLAIGAGGGYGGVGDAYLPFCEALSMLSGELEGCWAAGTITTDQARRLWAAVPEVGEVLAARGAGLVGTLLDGGELLGRLRAAVSGGGDWLERLERLANAPPNGQAGVEQSHLFEQYANVLLELSTGHPVLLVLDDMHWAGMASISLLFHLGRRLEHGRILLLGAYRPEELTPGQDGQRHPLQAVIAELGRRFGDVSLDLAAADEAEGRQFVDQLVDSEPNRLEEHFREILFQHTTGHPLFTIELLRDMQERGGLQRDEQGRWIEGERLDWGHVPARAEAAIGERIARLPKELRELLAVASVEGEEFMAQTAAIVEGMDELYVLRVLNGELMQRHRLVHEQGERIVKGRALSRYRFSHFLVQQQMYNSLGEGERRLLHRRVGEALERLYEGRLEDVAVQLVHHFTGDPERERRYARLAGERTAAQFANKEAIRYLGRALELTPADGRREQYELLLARETILDRLGHRGLQSQDLADLKDLAVLLKDDHAQAEVALRQSDYYRVTGNYVAAIEAAREAIALAERSEIVKSDQNAYDAAAGHLRWGNALLYQGAYETGLIQFGQVQDLIKTVSRMSAADLEPVVSERRCGRAPSGQAAAAGGHAPNEAILRWRQLAADTHCCQGLACWRLGQSAVANAHYQEALVFYCETEDLRGQASAVNGLGVIAWSQGNSTEAWTCFQQSLRWLEQVGDERGRCRALSNLGDIAIYRGDYPEARQLCGQCLPICQGIGEPWIESGVLNNLGIIADRSGAYADALTHLHQALDQRREIGDRQGEAESLSDLGLVYHHMGDDKASLDCSEQSLSIIEELKDPFILGFVLTRLGHALAGLGLLDEAAAAYGRADLLRREGRQAHAQVEALAGLARVALARGDSGRALACVEEILQQTMGDNLSGCDEPLRVYLTCYQVLRASGDARAEKILQMAYQMLEDRAARIYPEELQRSFLQSVAAHREIIANWRACSTSPAPHGSREVDASKKAMGILF